MNRVTQTDNLMVIITDILRFRIGKEGRSKTKSKFTQALCTYDQSLNCYLSYVNTKQLAHNV